MMNSKIIANGILRAFFIVVGVALLLYFLYLVRSVIGYITAALVISLIGRPIVLFFRNKLKFNNTLAVVITMLFFLGVLVGIIGLFIPLLVKQGHNLSLLDIETLKASGVSLYEDVMNYLDVRGANSLEALKRSGLFDNIDYSIIPNLLNGLVNSLGNFGIGLFSTLFISFFFLKDSQLFQNSLLALIPNKMNAQFKASMAKIKNLLSRYFLGLMLQILVLFIIYTLGLLIVGIENAVVIAFLCALVNLIPYLGPLIGGALMIILTMTSNLDGSFNEVIAPKVLGVLIVITIGQLIDNFGSQPIIFSKSVKSHPLEIFLVIIIAGLLFGILGMILAVPTYTTIKVILKEFLSEYKIVRNLTKSL